MNPTPSAVSLCASCSRYASSTDGSTWTSESRLTTRSMESSPTMSSERPSLTWKSMFVASANRARQWSMQPSVEIDDDEVVGEVLEVLRPSAVPRRDLEDRARGDERLQSRLDRSEPHRMGAAPPGRPLVALRVPEAALLPGSPVAHHVRHGGKCTNERGTCRRVPPFRGLWPVRPVSGARAAASVGVRNTSSRQRGSGRMVRWVPGGVVVAFAVTAAACGTSAGSDPSAAGSSLNDAPPETVVQIESSPVEDVPSALDDPPRPVVPDPVDRPG